MVRIKLFIAKLFCIISILLISCNIGFSSFGYEFQNNKESTLVGIDKNHTPLMKDGQRANDFSSINLLKDPTEGDVEFFFAPFVIQKFIFEILLISDKDDPTFSNYFPLLKSIPLWIENRQILI